MTNAPEPLDLSLLARVSSDSTFSGHPSGTQSPDRLTREDSAPKLPGNESDAYREEPTRPRSAGPSRPRSTGRGSSAAWRGKTRASVESERPPPTQSSDAGRATREPQSVVRDDTPTYHAGMLVKPLTDLYVVIGTAVYPFNPRIGTTFVENAKACAESLDQAARVDKKLRQFLMSLVGASVWGPVIVAHAPIAMAIAVELMPNLKGAQLPTTNGQPA